MFLRFLMVGLVSCLGLEVPSTPAAGDGAPPRCAFCEGRPVAEVLPAAEAPPVVEVVEELPMPDGLDAFAVEAEEMADPDAAFQTVMTATIGEFQADLAAVAPAAPAEVIAEALVELVPIVEETVAIEPADEELYPGLAYALNREAEGLTILEVAPIEPETVAVVEAAEPLVDEAATDAATRGQRIEAAVRLTGQAVSAWLSVLQTPAMAYDAEGSTVSR